MFDHPRSFVHLDVRSYFSLKDGAFSPADLAVRAAELGMRSIALTDRDGVYGATRFVDACERTGIRPLLGASVSLEDAGSSVEARPPSAILLATDAAGYANLCRLLTAAHMLGEHGVGRPTRGRREVGEVDPSKPEVEGAALGDVERRVA